MRDQRPFAVVTDGTFASIEALATRILQELQVTGSATLTRTGDQTSLIVQFEVPEDEDGSATEESPIAALWEDLDRYRIVLTDGSFQRADGFELRNNGRMAVPIPRSLEEIRADGGTVRLALSW